MAHIHDKRDPQCLAVFARLSEYIDGELPEADCREIENHLADCPPCIEFLRQLRASVDASKEYRAEVTPPPIPEALKQRLLAAWSAAVGGKPTSQA